MDSGFRAHIKGDLNRLTDLKLLYGADCHFVLTGIHQKQQIDEKYERVIYNDFEERNNLLSLHRDQSF